MARGAGERRKEGPVGGGRPPGAGWREDRSREHPETEERGGEGVGQGTNAAEGTQEWVREGLHQAFQSHRGPGRKVHCPHFMDEENEVQNTK